MNERISVNAENASGGAFLADFYAFDGTVVLTNRIECLGEDVCDCLVWHKHYSDAGFWYDGDSGLIVGNDGEPIEAWIGREVY